MRTRPRLEWEVGRKNSWQAGRQAGIRLHPTNLGIGCHKVIPHSNTQHAHIYMYIYIYIYIYTHTYTHTHTHTILVINQLNAQILVLY